MVLLAIHMNYNNRKKYVKYKSQFFKFLLEQPLGADAFWLTSLDTLVDQGSLDSVVALF